MSTPGDKHESFEQRRPPSSFWVFGMYGGVVKIAAFCLQLYLGFVFLPSDFGIVAIFSSAAMLANAFRDAGVGNELIRQRAKTTDPVFAEAYWLSWLTNASLAVLIALSAKPLSSVLQAPGLTPLLLCLAITYPLGTLWSVSGPVIQTQISAGRWVSIQLEGEAIRYLGTMLLLTVWPEPIVLAIGFALQAAWLSIRGARAALVTLRQPRPTGAALGQLWSRTRWLVSGTLAAAFLQSGDYWALGLVTSVATLGAYFFAFSLPAQAGMVAVALGDSLILELDRQRSARRTAVLLSATRRLVAVTGLLTWSLAVCLPYLEQLLWRGKWEFAVPASQVLSLFFPFRLLFILQKIALVTSGAYRKWSSLTLAQGLGMVGAAALAGSQTDSLVAISFWIGLYMALATLTGVAVALRPDQIGARALAGAVARGIPVPLISSSGAMAMVWIAQKLGWSDNNFVVLGMALTAIVVLAIPGFRITDPSLYNRVAATVGALSRRVLKRK